jgi:acyltransferase
VAANTQATDQLRAQSANRSVAIDLVRLLGLLVVVAGHVWADRPIGGYVAVFFVLSGYLWSDKRSPATDLKHRVRILLVPYLSWLILVGGAFLTVQVVQGRSPRELLDLAARLIWGGEKIYTPLTAFWFLTAIFAAVVVYKQLRRLPRGLFYFGVALCLAATFAGPQLADLPLALGTGVACVAFVAAGHGFRWLEPRLQHPLTVGVLGAIAGASLVISGLSDRMDLKHGYFGTPILSILVACILGCSALLIAKRLAPHLPTPAGGLLTHVVRMSTPIILLQTVPLWLLPDSTPHWVLFFAGLVLPVVIGSLLLMYPRSWARKLLMPGK